MFNFVPVIREIIAACDAPNIYFEQMSEAARLNVNYLAFHSYERPTAKTNPCETFGKVTELALENTPMSLVKLHKCHSLKRAWFRGNVLPGKTVKTLFNFQSVSLFFLLTQFMLFRLSESIVNRSKRVLQPVK